MWQLILCAALAPAVLAAEAAPEVGTQLTYRGSLAPGANVAADPAKGTKSFDLTMWIMARGEAGTDVFWLIDETGNGEFPWPARFGRAALDAKFIASGAGPALLYDRGDGRSVVPVLLPLFAAAEPLADGADFKDGSFEFHVDKETRYADRPAWQVSVRDPFGPKRLLLVDKHSPLVVGMTERVVMGRGEQYELKLDLDGMQQLSGEQLTALAAAIDALTALRDKLNLPAQSQEIDWKPAQLDLLREQLPAAAKSAAGTALANLATAAKRDVDLQSGRGDAVAALGAKFQGHAVDDFQIRGLGDDALRRADLDGQVTVLHFWDYRDEPLREPYGQVGYLDFLYHRRKSSGLRLYGVAVNGRLGEEPTRAAAERSVKKLKSFMNLSYPVLLDAGALLKQFGDPRVLGANLPLFVVIGPDGKIIHYHVGTYEVHQDQGLKELDDIVAQALEKK